MEGARQAVGSTTPSCDGEIAFHLRATANMIFAGTPMDEIVGKLTTGQPLSIDQLIEYLPALKEIPRAQLENWAKGAAVLHRFRKGERSAKKAKSGRPPNNMFWGRAEF